MGCVSSQPVAPKPKTPVRRGVHAGVQLGWLKRFAERVPPDMSTFDVVMKIIKPATMWEARSARHAQCLLRTAQLLRDTARMHAAVADSSKVALRRRDHKRVAACRRAEGRFAR